MDQNRKLSLINGCFTDAEAKEILMNIFSAKIQFHKVKNFSSQVRHGKDDEIAQNRISDLKKEQEKILQILSEASSKNMKLAITSEINIALITDETEHLQRA